MFFTHLTARSFRENITHAEQGWANPSRINELEVPDPSGQQKAGAHAPFLLAACPVFQLPADSCPLTGCLLSFAMVYRALKHRPRTWGDSGAEMPRKMEKPLSGTGQTCIGCAGVKRPGKTRPSPLRGRAAGGEIPPKRGNDMGEKAFHRGAAKPWAGEAAAPSPQPRRSHGTPPHRSPKPYCTWKTQRKGMRR